MFDKDGSGCISSQEFQNGIRNLGLGVTNKEIEELMKAIDKKDLTNHTRYDYIRGDGKINMKEFINSLLIMPDNQRRLAQRAASKLLQMKEMMILHMTSASDAFNMFAKKKKGFMTIDEFQALYGRLNEMSAKKLPQCDYLVLKDLFYAIDIGKDGLLDKREWDTTF